MKRYIAGLLVLCLIGCSKPIDSQKVNMHEEFTMLEEENHFTIAQKDSVVPFLEHGTGILLLAYPEDEWSQAFALQLEEVIQNVDMNANYYNIHVDESEDPSFYKQICHLLEDQNDSTFGVYKESDGKRLIDIPMILFVSEGRITHLISPTSFDEGKHSSTDLFRDETVQQQFKNELQEHAETIKKKQDELHSEGCDTGCEAFENND